MMSKAKPTKIAFQGVVSNLHCASCVNKIERCLQELPGVDAVAVNLADRSLLVRGNSDATSIINALAAIGYTAVSEPSTDATQQARLHRALVATAVGVLIMLSQWFQCLPALTAPYGTLTHLGVGVLTLATMIYSGHSIYHGCWRSILHRQATMDTLIAIGTASAWIFSMVIVLLHHQFNELRGYEIFEASVMILAFVNLGSWLEARARGKTSQAIERLLHLQPQTANVMRDNQMQQVPLTQVKVRDILSVHPGEQIPVDGVVIDGESYVNESMLTGEPTPLAKKTDDQVVAGSLNTSGRFLMRAEKVGEETALARIINLVKQAQTSKPAISRLVDKISAYFVPTILILAAITAMVWFNFGPSPRAVFTFITAMTVLIIACPCALGLATPISIMVGIGKAAEYGALIRNGEALQRASQITALVLDKTGTITKGKPTIVAMNHISTIHKHELLALVASVERFSEHPLGHAVIEFARQENIETYPIEYFQNLEGFGVRAKVKGKWLVIGKRLFMDKNELDFSEFTADIDNYTAQAHTIIYVGYDEKPLGLIAVADPIRDDARDALKRLQALPLRIIMLTGDNQQTAERVADVLGIEQIVANVLPHQKLNTIQQLQADGEIVGMVGDGINDAPALAQADVGFAMGAGTDVALESADVALMRNSLHAVVDAIAISQATLSNIKQNLLGAFIYNLVGIPIAAGMLYPFMHLLLNPMFAGAAMAASSVTVVTNANRLRLFKPD